MLSIVVRQRYLKELGYYKGAIDGIVGNLTRNAYLNLQKDYFGRKSDIDGIYGNNTDILLQNVYNFKDSRYFKVSEFKCHCSGKGCTGYPAVVSKDLIKNMNKMREYYGAITITSGLRCTYWNNRLSGSSKESKHKLGKACDSVNSNYRTYDARKKAIDTFLKMQNANMGYCNGFMKYKNGSIYTYNAPNMVEAVHLEVK